MRECLDHGKLSFYDAVRFAARVEVESSCSVKQRDMLQLRALDNR